MARRKKKRTYKFSTRKKNKKGMLSLALGILALLLFIGLVIFSYIMSGNASVFIGSIGLTSIIFSIAGLVIGLSSFKEHDISYVFSKIGSLFNFFILIMWAAICVTGSYGIWW